MRIKTSINHKVERFVQNHWPEKWVNCNYLDDSLRTRDDNRWIQIGTPINDSYIHYEINYQHVELHFEYSDELKSGITAHQDLVDYLEKTTETDNLFEWTDFLGGDSVRCVYTDRVIEWDDMLEKLKFVISFFDPLIQDFYAKRTASKHSSISVAKTSVESEKTVDLMTLMLGDIYTWNLHIPDYQRIYCWEEKHVKCLLSDLLFHRELHEAKNSPYRLGTIILHCHDGVFDIIDGQQRLVTLSLLLDELGIETCLMTQHFDSSVAQNYVGFNKYLIENYVRKHVADKEQFLRYILENIQFNVLTLQNASLDLAYTFFSNENSRGVALTDYDLLKAHHLRFIPESYEQQSRKAADTWNQMIQSGRIRVTEDEPIPDYERTLDTYLFNLRQWMRMQNVETKENDRHIKNEYEAAPIMPELPPFGEQFFFNEPIQGGTHFFAFTEAHLTNYHLFVETEAYKAVHSRLMGRGSIQWYRNAIETLLFGYFEKFGQHCLSDATVLVARRLLEDRYNTTRAQKDSIYKEVAERGTILQVNRATSPTFFLAELYLSVRDFPVKYLQDMTPIQRYMRRAVIDIKNDLKDFIYVESIKNMKI